MVGAGIMGWGIVTVSRATTPVSFTFSLYGVHVSHLWVTVKAGVLFMRSGYQQPVSRAILWARQPLSTPEDYCNREGLWKRPQAGHLIYETHLCNSLFDLNKSSEWDKRWRGGEKDCVKCRCYISLGQHDIHTNNSLATALPTQVQTVWHASAPYWLPMLCLKSWAGKRFKMKFLKRITKNVFRWLAVVKWIECRSVCLQLEHSPTDLCMW